MIDEKPADGDGAEPLSEPDPAERAPEGSAGQTPSDKRDDKQPSTHPAGSALLPGPVGSNQAETANNAQRHASSNQTPTNEPLPPRWVGRLGRAIRWIRRAWGFVTIDRIGKLAPIASALAAVLSCFVALASWKVASAALEIAGTQATYAQEQGTRAEEQKEIADEQRKIAADALDLNRKQMARSLRAWVTPESVEVDWNTVPPSITVNCINSGQTPALDVRGWVRRRPSMRDSEPGPEDEDPDLARSTLGPDMSRAITPTLDTDEDAPEWNATDRPYVLGEIRYVDIFGCHQVTDFCFVVRVGSRSGPWCTRHNWADTKERPDKPECPESVPEPERP